MKKNKKREARSAIRKSIAGCAKAYTKTCEFICNGSLYGKRCIRACLASFCRGEFMGHPNRVKGKGQKITRHKSSKKGAAKHMNHKSKAQMVKSKYGNKYVFL